MLLFYIQNLPVGSFKQISKRVLILLLTVCMLIFFIIAVIKVGRLSLVLRGFWIPMSPPKTQIEIKTRRKKILFIITFILISIIIISLSFLYFETIAGKIFFVIGLLLFLLAIYNGSRLGVITQKDLKRKSLPVIDRIINKSISRQKEINVFTSKISEMRYILLNSAEMRYLLERAMSFSEKQRCYKGADNIALTILPSSVRRLLHFKFLRKIFSSKLGPKGYYEYLIARTKYIDELFIECMKKNFNQILIVGSRYDTRSIRYGNLNDNRTEIFELDYPNTEINKLKMYKKNNISVPSNLHFVSMNLEEISQKNSTKDHFKDSFKETLNKVGFKSAVKTLYILEGITMYLTPETVESLFKFIKTNAGNSSKVVFDYIHSSVYRQEGCFYGEEKIFKMISINNQPWGFGLEKGSLDAFLEKFGITLLEKNEAKNLESKYFTNSHNEIVAKINDTHVLVTGKIDDFRIEP